MNKSYLKQNVEIETTKPYKFKIIYATVSTYNTKELTLEGIQKTKKNGSLYFKRSDINWSMVTKNDIVMVKNKVLNYNEIDTTKFNYHTYHFYYNNFVIYTNLLLINDEVILDENDYDYFVNLIDELHIKYPELISFTLYHNYKNLKFKIGTYDIMTKEIFEIKNNLIKKINKF